jgi:methionyl-tRNA formyltransferase
VLEVAVTSEGEARGGIPGEMHGEEVVTGRGSLRLLRVQPESRSPMSADEWLRGVRPAAGERLGTD